MIDPCESLPDCGCGPAPNPHWQTDTLALALARRSWSRTRRIAEGVKKPKPSTESKHLEHK